MAAYLITNVDIKDTERIKTYLASTPALIKKYGSRFLALGGEIFHAEGNWHPSRLVVVEFDTFEHAKAFWHANEYQPLKALRQSAVITQLIIVDGIKEPVTL